MDYTQLTIACIVLLSIIFLASRVRKALLQGLRDSFLISSILYLFGWVLTKLIPFDEALDYIKTIPLEQVSSKYLKTSSVVIGACLSCLLLGYAASRLVLSAIMTPAMTR